VVPNHASKPIFERGRAASNTDAVRESSSEGTDVTVTHVLRSIADGHDRLLARRNVSSVETRNLDLPKLADKVSEHLEGWIQRLLVTHVNRMNFMRCRVWWKRVFKQTGGANHSNKCVVRCACILEVLVTGRPNYSSVNSRSMKVFNGLLYEYKRL
jgi:hypothetical protein